MLPQTVRVVESEGKTYYLLGTAHVSSKSVEEVSQVIEEVQPDSVCIELCQSRFDSIKNKDRWKKTDIFTVIKQKKVLLLLTQLIMSSFYKRIGKELSVEPGAEMMKGAEEAEKRGVNLVLADRNIDITMKRVWGGLGFWQKMKGIYTLFGMLFFSSEGIDKDTVENLKEGDNIGDAMNELAKEFPGVKGPLVDERDFYLAEKIRTASGQKIVAVLGAAHCKGVAEYVKKPFDLSEIEKIPPKSIVPAIIGWGFCATIVGLLAYGIISGAENGIENIFWFWILNGGFSALFTAIAWGHPLAVITAFFVAPTVGLHPMIGTGWVVGLVQAALKKPTVLDMENVSTDIESVKGFWRNPLTRILLVVIFAGLGSALGRVLALGKIFNDFFVGFGG